MWFFLQNQTSCKDITSLTSTKLMLEREESHSLKPMELTKLHYLTHCCQNVDMQKVYNFCVYIMPIFAFKLEVLRYNGYKGALDN